MTRFAFGSKLGKPGRPFEANAGRVTSDASAAVPMPVAARPKSWRRVSSRSRSSPCSGGRVMAV
jgi:hypothetical protein